MSKNLVRYEGRIINKAKGEDKPGTSLVLKKSSTGKGCLELVVAEKFQERNDRAPDKFKDAAKAADAYVDTWTKWHRIQIWGSLDEGSPLLALARNPQFNHGAIVEVMASYRSEEYTRRKDNVEVQNDRESIFLDSETKNDGFDTWIAIKVSDKSKTVLGASEGFQVPAWDGVSDLPALGGGGGTVQAPAYSDDDGF